MNSFEGATLVIPTYNRAALIGETIESALAQTVAFSEIIIVNDGSTDNTIDVASNYLDVGSIKIITTANNGVQAARNLGVATAKTELVVLCDSDDLLCPDYLATIGSWMSRTPLIDCTYSNFTTFSSKGEDPDKLRRCPFDFLSGSTYAGNIAMHIPDLYIRSVRYQPLFSSGVMIRKSFYMRIGGYNTAFRGVGAEDWEFTLRAISSGEIAMCRDPLVKIRKHEHNDSKDAIRMNLGEAQILEHGLKEHSAAKNWEHEITQNLKQRKIQALDGAYAQKNFDLALRIGKDLKWNIPRRNQAKLLISLLPKKARNFFWNASQNIR
jgi:glycosyltransferase involved in cell wall biosynthesis